MSIFNFLNLHNTYIVLFFLLYLVLLWSKNVSLSLVLYQKKICKSILEYFQFPDDILLYCIRPIKRNYPYKAEK